MLITKKRRISSRVQAELKAQTDPVSSFFDHHGLGIIKSYTTGWEFWLVYKVGGSYNCYKWSDNPFK